MRRISKFIKFQIIYCFIFAIAFYIMVTPLACYCFEPVQTITITKEDLKNAKPTIEEVNFSKKDLHVIEVLENRHFPRTYPELTDNERLRNLEFELLGRVWEYTKQQDRIKTLKIASSNRMLIGMSLPPSISSKRNAKKMRNDSIQMREPDNVGLIDGFLRLINPDLYEQYRKSADSWFEYEY